MLVKGQGFDANIVFGAMIYVYGLMVEYLQKFVCDKHLSKMI